MEAATVIDLELVASCWCSHDNHVHAEFTNNTTGETFKAIVCGTERCFCFRTR